MRHGKSARWGAALALAALVLAPLAAASAGETEITSGIPVGGGTPAFQVQDVTGAAKGGRVCYV